MWKRRSKRIEISEKVPLDSLNGGGPLLAAPFVDFIRDRPRYRKSYSKAFEWCSGPGWIGLELLSQGVCESLCLADVNPRAIESVRHTIDENELGQLVTCYISDNLESVPATERFDLVVGNPPGYTSVHPEHPFQVLHGGDLRVHDPSWRIRRAFYSTIRAHLEPGAVLLISEVAPYEATVYLESDPLPCDVRGRAPHVEFVAMIEDGGLRHLETTQYFTGEGPVLWMMVSELA